MARDVEYYKDEGLFKLRVCGIIRKGDKVLIEKDSNSQLWSYPGGRVKLGESTIEAVKRELKEELGIEIEVVKKLACIQLFSKLPNNAIFHEIGFYYQVNNLQPLPCQDFDIEEEIDKGKQKHNFKWITIDQLKEMDVVPRALKDVIISDLENQDIISCF